MGFSLHKLVFKFQELEAILADDFQIWFRELRTIEKATRAKEADTFKLVELLQFHDILRQKIEHIRHFWETRQAAPGKGEDVLPEMVELSIALLRFTSLEYEEVTTKVMQLLPDGSRQGGNNEELLFATRTRDLIKELEEIYVELDLPEGEVDVSSGSRLKKMWNSFSMQSERDVFSMLFPDESLPEQDGEGDDPQGQVELF